MLVLLNSFGFTPKHYGSDHRADYHTDEQASMR
jgi:hypothetical protein